MSIQASLLGATQSIGDIASYVGGRISAQNEAKAQELKEQEAKLENEATAQAKAEKAKQAQENFNRTMSLKEAQLKLDTDKETNRASEANRQLDIRKLEAENDKANREARESKLAVKQENSGIFANQTKQAERNTNVRVAMYGDSKTQAGQPVGGVLGMDYYNVIGQQQQMKKVQDLGAAKAQQQSVYKNQDQAQPQYPIFGRRPRMSPEENRARSMNVAKMMENKHRDNREKKRDRDYE